MLRILREWADGGLGRLFHLWYEAILKQANKFFDTPRIMRGLLVPFPLYLGGFCEGLEGPRVQEGHSTQLLLGFLGTRTLGIFSWMWEVKLPRGHHMERIHRGTTQRRSSQQCWLLACWVFRPRTRGRRRMLSRCPLDSDHLRDRCENYQAKPQPLRS